MRTSTQAKPFTITHRNLQNIAGPGPRRIVLGPGDHAWFAVGSATAYDPPLITFRSVSYALASGVKATRISLPATAPSGQPYPIGVTAYAAGDPPLE